MIWAYWGVSLAVGLGLAILGFRLVRARRFRWAGCALLLAGAPQMFMWTWMERAQGWEGLGVFILWIGVAIPAVGVVLGMFVALGVNAAKRENNDQTD